MEANRKMESKFSVLKNVATETDLLVDLTFHSIPAKLLIEFAQKIVRPYYQGNLNHALKDLIEKAITEQQLLQNHMANC
jgi:hypothetical protein